MRCLSARPHAISGCAGMSIRPATARPIRIRPLCSRRTALPTCRAFPTNALPQCSDVSCRRGCGIEKLRWNLIQGAYRPGIGRFLYRLLRLVHGFFRLTGSAEGANNTEFAMNLPYRGLARFTGAVTEAQVRALLMAANREKGGCRALIRALLRKRSS